MLRKSVFAALWLVGERLLSVILQAAMQLPLLLRPVMGWKHKKPCSTTPVQHYSGSVVVAQEQLVKLPGA